MKTTQPIVAALVLVSLAMVLSSVVRGTGAQPVPTAPGVARWEYGELDWSVWGEGQEVVFLTAAGTLKGTDPGDFLAKSGVKVADAREIQVLNYLGAQGWEIAHREQTTLLGVKKFATIFKRPLR